LTTIARSKPPNSGLLLFLGSYLENWQATLADREDPDLVRQLRTKTGRPLASDSFLGKLETKLGRRLRPLPPGVPKAGESRTKKGRNGSK
jgi:hypothetical protein